MDLLFSLFIGCFLGMGSKVERCFRAYSVLSSRIRYFQL